MVGWWVFSWVCEYSLVMSFWRSSTVNCYQLILPRQNAHRIVEQLGRLSNLAFRHNAHLQMTYAAQIKVIEETLIKLRLIEEKIRSAEGAPFLNNFGKEELEAFLELTDRKYRLERRASAHILETLIQEINGIWERQGQLAERLEQLRQQAVRLKDEETILKAGKALYGESLYTRRQAERPDQHIAFKCGVIGKKQENVLRRTLFRMTKGLSIYTSIDYSKIWPEEEAGGAGAGQSNQQQAKTVFFLILGYGESRTLSSKVQKLLDNYGIRSYQYPQGEQQSKVRWGKLEGKLTSNKKLVEMVKEQMKDSLQPLLQLQYTENKIKFNKLEYSKLYLVHQRKIYERLNEMKPHHNFYQTFVFIEAKNIEKVTSELQNKLVDDQMPSPQFIPVSATDLPTLFEVNTITRTPYEVLCSYGTPHYKEVNPAMLNLTTFPFLFGVMFGDMAHGALLLVFGLLLIFRSMKNPVTDFLHPHRHTIVLMGFFSFYCGLIYNEFLSLSLNIFGTCYQVSNSTATLREGCVYPVGVDPIWSVSANDLNFTNSLKMKISVIIAIVHMTLGLIVKGLNCWYLGKKIRIILGVLPQATFLLAIFGYMDFLIVYKWLHQWAAVSAPSIITTMIDIPLELGGTMDCCGGQPMWGVYGNTSQDKLQLFLLIISLACIPAMFFLPLLYEALARRLKKRKEKELGLNDELAGANSRMREREVLIQGQEQTQVPLKEMVVYQLIETIQFVLGCISNTASYLRLWALSLAHSQLSEVFFNQTVARGMDSGYMGILYNLVLFPIYAGISFGILMCMDSMECFLHTLRLHWVEFQSKFYRGDGVPFKSDDFLTYANQELQKQQK